MGPAGHVTSAAGAPTNVSSLVAALSITAISARMTNAIKFSTKLTEEKVSTPERHEYVAPVSRVSLLSWWVHGGRLVQWRHLDLSEAPPYPHHTNAGRIRRHGVRVRDGR